MILEDVVHDLPEAFLPLEDRLFRDYVRHHLLLEAAGEKDVRKVLDIVERVVIHDDGAPAILELPPIDHHGLVLHVLREERGQHTTSADLLPSGAILAPHGVPLEQHRPLEAELDARDMDRVAGNCDAVPTLAHEAVRRAQGLQQAHGPHLLPSRGDGGLLEDGPDALACGHGVPQHRVARLVTRRAAQIVELPRAGVDGRLDPPLEDQLHRVPRHLLP
mmetsp:Transcript_17922/g.53411  ORF Transcript_17922/g.53411 Transcript_17922/m.53411 type:complete len:219 (-) Transcript_17922:42-698(-)